MKTMLILLLLAICTLGWHSESIMRMLGMPRPAEPYVLQTPENLPKNAPAGMTMTEFAELSRTDPNAYRKLLQSYQHEQERGEIDKLMNFFARLKYE